MGLRLARTLGLANGTLPVALGAEVLVEQSAGDELCCAVDVPLAIPGRLMSHQQRIPGIHSMASGC